MFEVFTDLSRAEERISAIVKLEILTDGPVGVGTRFRETRRMFKRESTEEMEVTDLEPGASYAIGGEACGCAYLTDFQFEEDGLATNVNVHFSSRSLTFMAKIMSPVGLLMMGAVKKAFDKDLEELKAAAESGDD